MKKQKHEVNKKTLQLYIKELAQETGRIPTREDVLKLDSYPIEYFDDYFINWGEVTAAARTTGMENVENKSNYKIEQQLRLFEDKKRKYGKLNTEKEKKKTDS